MHPEKGYSKTLCLLMHYLIFLPFNKINIMQHCTEKKIKPENGDAYLFSLFTNHAVTLSYVFVLQGSYQEKSSSWWTEPGQCISTEADQGSLEL